MLEELETAVAGSLRHLVVRGQPFDLVRANRDAPPRGLYCFVRGPQADNDLWMTAAIAFGGLIAVLVDFTITRF
jgi:hypothetical protein